MINLKNTNILLTGATGGIGNSILENLVIAEANVVATGTNEEKLNKIKNKYQSVKVEKFDISEHKEIENFINKVSEEMDNKIDVLINNAGVTNDNLSIRMKEDEWKRVIDINLTGTFICCREIIKDMIKSKYGRIVNIASVAGKEGNPNAAHYSASKSGVITFTRSLGKELANSGVLVNCITPAVIETEMLSQVSDEHKAYMISKIPMSRMGQPKEVSSLICWLSSSECSYSTAAAFDLSGGRSTY